MIRWIKKYADCYYICSKQEGCHIDNAHKLCKTDNLQIYEQLDNHFSTK